MFNNFGDRFEKPTVCQIIAAICDPRTTRPFWCDVFEKVTYRAHTIDVIVVVMMQSKSRGGVGATSTDGAVPDACAMPGRKAPARKDDHKKEDLDHADLLFAEILETCDMSARRFPLNRPRRFWLRPGEWPATDRRSAPRARHSTRPHLHRQCFNGGSTTAISTPTSTR